MPTGNIVPAQDQNHQRSPFDSIRRAGECGKEFWMARELQELLGYARWIDTLRAKATEILNSSGSAAINTIKGDCQGCL